MDRTKRLIAVFFVAVMMLSLTACGAKPAGKNNTPEDGTYLIDVTLAGGSGKASVASPAELTVNGGGMEATIIWSSANYDYMLVNDERYEPEIIDGHSVFKIPVSALDTELSVVADTVAMSTPHEIEYTLFFDSSSLAEKAAS